MIKGEYFENVFDTWRSKVYTDDSIFISSIAFVRNIIEYIYGRNDDNYIKLTSLLHYKNSPENDDLKTENITVGNISEIFSTYWGRDKNKFSQTSTKKVIDLILEKADEIYQNSRDLIHIENKIVLCIAIRLLTEKYMISKISDSSKTDFITGNQTRKLYELLPINRLVKKEQEIENIVEKVLIVTSENIHINSFMYEPIVDMSLEEIKDLYIRVKTTLNIV